MIITSGLQVNNMLILIEGCDGSGKTTLCKALGKYNFNVFPSIPRGESDSGELWYNLAYVNKLRRHTNIMDRSFISDLVYRTYDNDKAEFGIEKMLAILSHDCKIVYCKTDTCYEDSIARGEDNIVTKEASDKIQNIYDTYMTMFEKFTHVPVIHYNWKTDSLENLVKLIRK